MRKVGLVSGFAFVLALGSAPGVQDVQLRAMKDELARSKTLQLNELAKPYYISYSSDDADTFLAVASFGGTLTARRNRERRPHVQVRVGDYASDNGNTSFTRQLEEGPLPLDENYGAIRATYWIASDRGYKQASGELSLKHTLLRELSDPDTTPDFSAAPRVEILRSPSTLRLDENYWTGLVERLSARFVHHPATLSSTAHLRTVAGTFRFVNSDGSEIRVPENLAEIQVRASALAKDGMRLRNRALFEAESVAGLPGEEQLTRTADRVAGELDELVQARPGDDYSGPVLFEGEAAAQMMAQVLGSSLRLLRRPLIPPNTRQPSIVNSVWASKLGARVLPDWLTVVDDPGLTHFGATPLLGHYEVDEEGVAPKRLTLVDHGVLRAFLLTRQPVRRFAASNGHARLHGAFGAMQAIAGNLMVENERPVRESELRTRLIEAARQAGLQYGMLIRRLDYPSTLTLEEWQATVQQLQRSGSVRSLAPPLIAVRVHLDGREELVRNMRFLEFSGKDLKNIEAASDQPYVLNYVNNGTAFGLLDAPVPATTSSVVCPALLFDSVELERADEETTKAPLVPPPLLVAGQ